MERWRLPVVLCATTTSGTINCSLPSIEALRRARSTFSESPSLAKRTRML
ncbi:hypothetical protein [Bradyrhizobium vignae]